MGRKHVNLKSFILFLLLLLITKVRLEDHKGKRNLCAYLHCNENDVCVHRKFRCRDPPCPGMLYCAKSRTESLKGPSTCDTVRCTNGYVCTLKVRRCRWDETRCGQQIARCVSQKEYHEGPASCAGFKCSQGSHCILRESFCVNPPCKLLRSCAKNKEVHLWFGKCRILGCPSEFDCFLRRPENTCLKPPCKHTPDCVTTTENEITNAHCRGWICPRMQKCSAKITGNCKLSDCTIQRTCHEDPSNYSSSFSRRSFNNEKDHVSSKIEPKVSWNNSQENNEKIKIPHPWLSHLKSRTELDAIELWVKNAEGHKDFKQFQDWLQSVKDILGPGTYRRWLEEILSSRGEEFRKWLRASHVDKLDGKKPIFPRGQRPQDQRPSVLMGNQYPDTVNTPSQVSNTKKEEINSFLGDKKLTNVIEKLLVSNKILEAALLNNLKQSNRSPFFDHIYKYPLHTEKQDLSSLLSKNKNMYEQPYFVFPVGNMKVVESSTFNDQDSRYHDDSQNQNGKSLQNEKVSKEAGYLFNVPDPQRNLSFVEEKSPPLRTKLYEDSEKKSRLKETYNNENPNIKLTDEAQYFDEIPINALEELMKSLQFSSIENVPHNFNDKSIERYEQNIPFQTPTEIIQNEEYHNNFNENADHKDTFNNQNSKGRSEFSGHKDRSGNFSYNFTSNILLNTLGNISIHNHSEKLTHVNSLESILKQNINENNDEVDLNLFLKLNKETLLPYIQSLMDAMNEENISLINMEPNLEATSMKQSFVKDNNFRIITKISNKLIPREMSQKKVVVDEKSYNLNVSYESQFLKNENLDDSIQNEVKRVSTEKNNRKQNGSRTTGLIYTNEEPRIRSHYSPPSYGISNAGDIDDEDYELETNGRDYINENNRESVVDYVKWD
uniref:uncharacterized protein LOC117605816 isoform X2 n=1 Tax=Osmia lignaria TaxID=473952 RepID=UPI0014789451|nr:uncharacterized protein LOC117605816 isoform X2 [Osmia lignaria]